MNSMHMARVVGLARFCNFSGTFRYGCVQTQSPSLFLWATLHTRAAGVLPARRCFGRMVFRSKCDFVQLAVDRQTFRRRFGTEGGQACK